MRFMNERLGDMPYELLFGSKGSFGIMRKPDAGRYPENMCIHGHIGLLVDHGGDHIGSFTSNSWLLHQFFDGHGYLAVELIHQHIGHADEMLGFLVGVRDASDQRKEFVESGFRQAGRVGIFFENSRRGHIDPFVGTLC